MRWFEVLQSDFVEILELSSSSQYNQRLLCNGWLEFVKIFEIKVEKCAIFGMQRKQTLLPVLSYAKNRSFFNFDLKMFEKF